MALLKVSNKDYDDMLSGKNIEASDEVSMKIMFKTYPSGRITINFAMASPIKVLVWIG